MNEDAPTVSLDLASRPENLTLVRGLLGAVAEMLAIDPELLDDLKTAVSEAANNVVMHAYGGDAGPLTIEVYVRDDELEVIVRDLGAGIPELTPLDDRMHGVGVPVIQALTERVEFQRGEGGGTEVRMVFPSQRHGRRLFKAPGSPASDDGWTRSELSGDAVVSLSPVALLGGVLGRLARALAASSRFSLDRFSDIYLVTDAIAAHANSAATGDRVGFGISAGQRRLELTIGQFRSGSSAELKDTGDPGTRHSPLAILSDELKVEPTGDGERLHVVMIDHRR